MNNMKYYDEDGFELEFEYDTSPEERNYYAQEYKNVNLVANKRIHCTSCNIHIGTPPSAEDKIQTHTVLYVTQCDKCYRFYNSGEFEKDEDGSEMHCRWCGRGGELYCCTGCPYVFCQKCILRNLSSDGLNDVLSNDNWKCYACAPKILYPLRAQHWALVNFIKKQIKTLNLRIMNGLCDADVIAFYMKKDKSICCPSKTTVPKRQRPMSSQVEEDEDWSELIDSGNLNRSSNRKKKKVKTNETLKNDLQKEKSKSHLRNKAKVSPVRKSSRKSSGEAKSRPIPTTTVTTNSVRKSSRKSSGEAKSRPRPTTTLTTNSNTIVSNQPSTEIACTPEIFSYFLDHSLENGGQNYTATTSSKQKKRNTSATSNRKNDVVIDVDDYSIDFNQTAVPPLVMIPLSQEMIHQLRVTAPTQAIHQQATYGINAPDTNAIQQQMEPRIYPNTNVGSARTQLESQMFSAMEICQQIDGKFKKLVNSIAYKTANKMDDIKELYIHLSYLLTYTSDRVRSLQEKCREDMRQLDFKNIVEPSDTIITLDDSDEERSPTKNSSNNENSKTAAETNNSSENDVGLSTSTEKLECNVDVTAMLQLDYEDHSNDAEASLLAGNSDGAEEIPTPPPLKNVHKIHNDKKLKSNVKIVLRRAENEFPNLMKKSLLQIMNRLIEENIQRKLMESNNKMYENRTNDDGQCKIKLEETNLEMESSNDNIERHISSDNNVENV